VRVKGFLIVIINQVQQRHCKQMFPVTFKGKSCAVPKLPAPGTCSLDGCATSGCETQGALIPIAYSPYATGASAEEPILDLVATRSVRKGAQLAFRFYPQTEGYMSANSVTLSFILTQNLFPGRLLRLTVDTTPGNDFTRLYARVQSQTIWTQIAAPTGNPIRPVQASVYVFFGQYGECGCGPASTSPVSAIGISTALSLPILPPTDVLSCKYSYTAQVPDNLSFARAVDVAVLGNWDFGMWQLAKWGTWASDAIANYTVGVNLYENNLVLVPTPGQFLPIGFKPYLQNLGVPLQYGQLAVVITRRVDVGTNLWLFPNTWDIAFASTDFGFKWSYPMPTLDPPNAPDVIPLALEPGTVLYMSRLGSAGNPVVSIGALIKGGLASTTTDILNLTLYTIVSPALPSVVDANSGVYTCTYTGPVPRNLTVGEDMRREPWPFAGGIIASVTGSPCIKTMGALHVRERLNNEPLVAWIDQLPPAFLSL
jgi:hypothetical protein